MSLKISASGLFVNHSLSVQSDGVRFSETAIGGGRTFRFSDIHCILMSPDHKLSFQVGQEVFSIPTDPNSQKHQTVIATLVQEVQRAGAAWPGTA